MSASGIRGGASSKSAGPARLNRILSVQLEAQIRRADDEQHVQDGRGNQKVVLTGHHIDRFPFI